MRLGQVKTAPCYGFVQRSVLSVLAVLAECLESPELAIPVYTWRVCRESRGDSRLSSNSMRLAHQVLHFAADEAFGSAGVFGVLAVKETGDFEFVFEGKKISHDIDPLWSIRLGLSPLR